MEVDYSEQALNDIAFWKKSGNFSVPKRISRLIQSIQETPFQSIGKPEALKYNLSGKCSRRISDGLRIVYEVFEDRIRVHSLRGHY